MEQLGPIDTLGHFPGERAALIELLGGLTPEDWSKPTACAGWNVHDVALHILYTDVTYLSRLRDGFFGPRPSESGDLNDPAALLDFINEQNGRWVAGARQMSPRLLIDFLRLVGGQIAEFRTTLDLSVPGGTVSWAGPERAPVWMDIAREYTEKWHHQQHIRDAVGKPGLTERHWCHPVLDAFARALPFALRTERPAPGSTVALEVTGDAGDVWLATMGNFGWTLARSTAGEAAAATSRVTMDQDTAWRLFTKGIVPEKAAEQIAIAGDPTLACRVLRMVTIIA
jgi:uncharacterized protein (TIGR03083 family)